MQRYIPALIRRIRHEATGVRSFDLVRADAAPLPPFAAGAHVDVKTGTGLIRSYSIVDPPECCGHYRIAVQLESDGRDPRTSNASALDGSAPRQAASRYACAAPANGLFVPSGKSILDVLLQAGIEVSYSCTQGICGSCRLGLIEGVPDHRDECLSEDEHAANRSIIACCSGARSGRLVLDL